MTIVPSRPLYRRVWFWLPALLVLAAAAHGALWGVATERIQAELNLAQTRARAAGWSAVSGVPVRSGWPFKAVVEVSDVAISGSVTGLPGVAEWDAPKVRIVWNPLQPRQIVLQAVGRQSVRVNPGLEIGILADSWQVEVPLTAGGPSRTGTLRGSGIHLSLPGGETAISTLRADWEDHPQAAPEQTTLGVQVSAETISLPPLPGARKWTLGQDIGSISADIVVTGPRETGSGRDAAAAWRDAGGKLLLRRLALQWGPLGLDASASLGLDKALQPAGTGRIALTGYEATLDALVAGGILAPRGAIAARGVIAILARPPENGRPSRVEVPVTLEDRVLSAGRFALTRLAEWTW